MKYTTKDIEDAALICSAAACSFDDDGGYWSIAKSLGTSDNAESLALDAWFYVASGEMFNTIYVASGLAEMFNTILDAEACSLLMSGWLPEGATRSGHRG